MRKPGALISAVLEFVDGLLRDSSSTLAAVIETLKPEGSHRGGCLVVANAAGSVLIGPYLIGETMGTGGRVDKYEVLARGEALRLAVMHETNGDVWTSRNDKGCGGAVAIKVDDGSADGSVCIFALAGFSGKIDEALILALLVRMGYMISIRARKLAGESGNDEFLVHGDEWSK